MDRPYSRLILKWFWDIWDHLLTLILMNLAAFALCITVVGIPFAWAAMTAVAADISVGRAPEWATFRAGMRRLGAASLLTLFLALFAAASFIAATVVYPRSLGMPGYFMAGITFWIALGAHLILLHVMPFAARPETGLKQAFASAAILFLRAPIFTAYLGLMVILFALVCMIIVPLMPLLGLAIPAIGIQAGWTILMRRVTYEEEMRRHGVDPILPKGSDDSDAEDVPKAKSWKEIKKREEAKRAALTLVGLENDEMERSFSEIIRPWKMED